MYVFFFFFFFLSFSINIFLRDKDTPPNMPRRAQIAAQRNERTMDSPQRRRIPPQVPPPVIPPLQFNIHIPEPCISRSYYRLIEFFFFFLILILCLEFIEIIIQMWRTHLCKAKVKPNLPKACLYILRKRVTNTINCLSRTEIGKQLTN